MGDTEQDDLTPEQAERLQVLRERIEERNRHEERTRFWATTDVTRRGHSLLQAAMTWDVRSAEVQAWIDEDEAEARQAFDSEG